MTKYTYDFYAHNRQILSDLGILCKKQQGSDEMSVLYEIEDISYSDKIAARQKVKTPQQRIEELEELVAYYKSELGIQIENTNIFIMCKALDIRPGAAHFILALYNAKCRVLTWEQLCDLIPGQNDDDHDDTRGPKLINTYAGITRKVLGEKSIDTAWGTGYCMTVIGRTKVLAILNPGGQ